MALTIPIINDVPAPVEILASEVTSEIAEKLPMRKAVDLRIYPHITTKDWDGVRLLATLPSGSGGWDIRRHGVTFMDEDVVRLNNLGGKEGWWIREDLFESYLTQPDTDTAAVEPVTSEQERHEADIKLIGEMLNRKAQEHGWCSEYEDVVNELNEKLNVSLPLRSKRKRITATIEVTLEADLDNPEAVDDIREFARASFIHSRLEGILDDDWSNVEFDPFRTRSTVTNVEAI